MRKAVLLELTEHTSDPAPADINVTAVNVDGYGPVAGCDMYPDWLASSETDGTG